MARRNEHSLDEIRGMILNAAESIIINEGYSALTVRKVTQKIGYTVASIYMVFTSMAELVLQIKISTLADLSKKLQLVPNANPEQHINELANTYLHFAVKNYNRWSMIYMLNGQSNEEYQQITNQLYSSIETDLALLVRNCSPQLIKQAARTLWNSIHGICSLSLTDLEKVDIHDVEKDIKLLVDNFVAGWKYKSP